MKPVLMFVLGAILASAIAVFVVNRKSAPEPAATAVVTSAPTPETPAVTPTPAAPEPVAPPAQRSGFKRVEPKSPKGVRTAAAEKSTPAPSSSQSAANSAPSTTATSPQAGGPPQTTISMPPAPSQEARPAAPVRVAKTVTIPAGTMLSVRVDDRLSSDTVQTGDSFRATLDQPLVIDGAVIAERGARVEGRIAEADRGGKVKGLATLGLELVRLNTSDGQRVRIQTEGFTKNAQKNTKKDAAKVGIGAGLGAAIGAIAGGGKGAAIGAGVGGAAGTGAVLATRGEAAEVPPETRLTFRLRDAITLTEKIN